jgi:hypothetical protein
MDRNKLLLKLERMLKKQRKLAGGDDEICLVLEDLIEVIKSDFKEEMKNA